MRKKVVTKEPAKTSKEKKPSKRPSKQMKPAKPTNKKKETKNTKDQKKEPEIASESLQSNKSQLGEIEEMSKKSEIPKIKTYEISSDEETSYILNFEQVNDTLRIKVSEKESFPPNEYENFYTLEDLIKIDKWFKIFYNIESLLIEFDQLTKNESFAIERRKKDCLSLYILFPINLLDKIEIPIPINEIDSKDLFLQLISKINEIDAKGKNDILGIDEKLDNLEHLISSMEANNNQGEENMENENENKENEHINENEQNAQDDENKNNLEEMKDALKQEIANNIQNSNEQHENENEQHENENENENEYLLIDQNQFPFQESTIFSQNEQERQKEVELMLEWLSPALANLPNPPKVLRTKLIFKSETDGDKAATFHEKCDNISPTITIIQTKEGFRYGGYTFANWEVEEESGFKTDNDAFIFSFDTMKKYESLDGEKSVLCSNSFGPNFGDGTICVPDNFNEDTNVFYQWPSIYNLSEKDELTLGKTDKIEVKEYEVYTIELNGNGEESFVNE